MSSMIAPTILTYHLGATVGAGTNEDWALFTATVPMQVIEVQFANGAAITGNATNYMTLSLKKGSTTIASRAFTSGSVNADTPTTLTLASASADTKINVGDVVTFSKVDSGTGMAVTAQATLTVVLLVGAHYN